MKNTAHSSLLLTAGFCLATVLGSAQAATLIHNDGFTDNNLALPEHPNYGSSVTTSGPNWDASIGTWGVTGTPDVQLLWASIGGNSGFGFDTYNGWDGRGNVVQLDGASGGNRNFHISFVPTNPVVAVSIRSFDLDAWSGGGDMEVDWYIRDSTTDGTVLASGTWTRDNAGGRDTISPEYLGALGQTLVLHFDHTVGDATYLALDNLSFDQIPEPGSALLGAVGLIALAMRRRK